MDSSDWRDDDEGGSIEWEDAGEERERERIEAIENPDPKEEHQIFQRVAVTYNWYYEYKPDIDDFEYSHEEQYEEGSPQGVYGCTCCFHEMSHSEALEHIKRARSAAE